MTLNKIDTARLWYERVWHQEDKAAIHEMMVPKAQAMGLGKKPHMGAEEFEQFHAAFLGILSNVKITINHYIEDGDWLAQRITLSANCRKTGKDVSMDGQIMLKIVDGKLVEGHNHFDFMGLYEQLGLLPADSFGTCLTGCRIG
jgi:hypothetical protein